MPHTVVEANGGPQAVDAFEPAAEISEPILPDICHAWPCRPPCPACLTGRPSHIVRFVRILLVTRRKPTEIPQKPVRQSDLRAEESTTGFKSSRFYYEPTRRDRCTESCHIWSCPSCSGRKRLSIGSVEAASQSFSSISPTCATHKRSKRSSVGKKLPRTAVWKTAGFAAFPGHHGPMPAPSEIGGAGQADVVDDE